MKIVLNKNPKHPFFFTVDKVIFVSQFNREQLVDESKCTKFHYDIISQAEKDGILTVIDKIATPTADPEFKGCPYSFHKLRRAIDVGEIDIEQAKEYLNAEKSVLNPRVTIIKTLENFIVGK